jgi:hypothetical protein
MSATLPHSLGPACNPTANHHSRTTSRAETKGHPPYRNASAPWMNSKLQLQPAQTPIAANKLHPLCLYHHARLHLRQDTLPLPHHTLNIPQHLTGPTTMVNLTLTMTNNSNTTQTQLRIWHWDEHEYEPQVWVPYPWV